jgi:serine/threonine protein kinase
MSERTLRDMINELISGLYYLHDLGVVHRDIKLENIMVSTADPKKLVPKIIDFGLSIVLTPGERTKDICGTLAYCSPEIVKKESYEKPTDVWSLGIVTYAIIRGKLPFVTDDKKVTI